MRQLTLPTSEHIKDDDNVDLKQTALAGPHPTPGGRLYRKSEAAAPLQAREGIAETNVALSAEQRRNKRKEALAKMRDLWNNSQARRNRIDGEDGVAFQQRMRAEW